MRVVSLLVTAIVALALPLTFPDGSGPTLPDRRVEADVHTHLDGHTGVLDATMIPSEARVLLPLLLAGAVWLLWRRLVGPALFLVAAPLVAVAINSWVLKPLYDRHLNGHLVYPSGHTVSLVAVATAFALVAASARARAIIAALGAAALVSAAVGMIGSNYHHPTDILGGACAGIAIVAALDRAVRLVPEKVRRASPTRSTPARQARRCARHESSSAPSRSRRRPRSRR